MNNQLNNEELNEEFYRDTQVYGLIEDMRDNGIVNSFRVKWNLRLLFGENRIERADITPFGPSRTTISADEALEVLHDNACLPTFVFTAGPPE